MDTGLWASDGFIPAMVSGEASLPDHPQTHDLIYGNPHNDLVYGGADGDTAAGRDGLFAGERLDSFQPRDEGEADGGLLWDLSPHRRAAPQTDTGRLY